MESDEPQYDPKKIGQYTVDDVVDFIKRGQLHVHPLRLKDTSIRKGAHWNLYQPIYDNHLELVRYFFYCPTCKSLLHVNTKISGTNPLTRHPCFKDMEMSTAYIEKPKIQKVFLEQLPIKNEVVEFTIPPASSAPVPPAPQVAMAPNKISMQQLQMLKDAFVGYGDVCNRFGPLAPEELSPIIPNEWSSASW